MEIGIFVSRELLKSYVPITNDCYIGIYFWLKEINLSVSLTEAYHINSENCSAIFQVFKKCKRIILLPYSGIDD